MMRCSWDDADGIGRRSRTAPRRGADRAGYRASPRRRRSSARIMTEPRLADPGLSPPRNIGCLFCPRVRGTPACVARGCPDRQPGRVGADRGDRARLAGQLV